MGQARESSNLVRLVLWGLLAVALDLPAARAESLRFEGMTLDAPVGTEGWARQDTDNSLMLRRSFPAGEGRRRAGEAIIILYRPIAAKAGAFPQVFAKAAQGIEAVAHDRRPSRREGQTVNGHPMLMEQRCCGNVRNASVHTFTIGVDVGETYHFLTLAMVNLAREEKPAVRARFEAMVRSLRPREVDRAFVLEPARGDGGLDGLYTSMDSGIRPNAFGGTDYYATSRVLLFDPGGLFSRAVPIGGDIAAHCAGTPEDCGTYRLRGGQIEMREVANGFGMMRTRSESFARDGDDLEIDRTRHFRVAPLPGGTTFEGSWTSSFASSGTTALSSGSVSSVRTLVLGRNGRFSRSGFTAASFSGETGGSRSGVTVGGRRPLEQGTYRVEGYRLMLTGSEGQEETLSFYKPDGASDNLLIVNGSNYLRAGRERQR